MNRRQTLTRWVVALAGVLLCLVGVIHDVVNVRSLQRVMARGEMTEHLGKQMIANAAFGGATLFLWGVILLIIARALRKPNRTLWGIGALIGVFFVVMGGVAYLWEPIPSVFLFSALGALVCIPLLVWRREFTGS